MQPTVKFQSSKEMNILLNLWKHQESFRVTGHISCYVLLLLLLLLTTSLTSSFQLQLLKPNMISIVFVACVHISGKTVPWPKSNLNLQAY